MSPALIHAVVDVVTEESRITEASTVASRSWTRGWYLPERTTISVFSTVPVAETLRCWYASKELERMSRTYQARISPPSVTSRTSYRSATVFRPLFSSVCSPFSQLW